MVSGSSFPFLGGHIVRATVLELEYALTSLGGLGKAHRWAPPSVPDSRG